jgi:hypothetical protein
VYVKAQAICNPPPLLSYWSAAHWPKFKNIKVEIDDAWDGTARGAFQTGISKWNTVNVDNCSIVTFTDFTPRHFTDYDTDAPADTVWWLKTDPGTGYNGGVFHSFTGTPPVLKSARIKIGPWNTNNADYFVYLGSHETGHTFGLADCLCSNNCNCDGENGLSIMSGQ